MLKTIELARILKKQDEQIKKLLALALKLKSALIDEDLEEIVSITSLQEAGGKKLALSENEARDLLQQYSAETGSSIEQLSDLSGLVETAEYEELQKTAEEIRKTYQELKTVQEKNQRSLKKGISYFNRMLSFLNRKPSSIYSSSGAIQNSFLKGRLDTNI